METQAIQDLYPDSYSHCFGCGRLNEHGLHIKSYREGDEMVCQLTPQPYHLAVPGFVYGGLIASVIDCHSIGTAAEAASAAARSVGADLAAKPSPQRFVTKSLHVDYLSPTPINMQLVVRSRVAEVQGRQYVVRAELFSDGVLRARGEVVAVPIPDHMVL